MVNLQHNHCRTLILIVNFVYFDVRFRQSTGKQV